MSSRKTNESIEKRAERRKRRLKRATLFARQCRHIGVVFFVVILLFFGIAGVLLFLRPNYSELENRELKEFPRPTAASFLDGSFFSDVSLWYSDTMPMRDALISANREIKKLYGFTGDERLVGGNVVADEIPEIGEETAAAEGSAQAGPTTAPDYTISTSDKPEVTPPPGEEEAAAGQTEVAPAEAPTQEAIDDALRDQVQQSLYVKDGAAYNLYYFVQDCADRYIAAVDRAAAALAGEAKFYSILVPNSSGVMLSEEYRNKLGGSDQKKAIDYYYTRYHSATPIPTIDTLREHSDEYLYFRTDHHWTQRGAYYVYREYCKKRGLTPHELEDFQVMEFAPFLGTAFATLNDDTMKERPDTVTAYVPMGTNDLTYWDKDGNPHEWSVIRDVTDWATDSKYLCFIGGDNPVAVIQNPAITDGSSCVVLKESYGNSFVPFLVDHYQTVHVLDFRYTGENLVKYVRDNKINDVIVINNLSVIGSSDLVGVLENVLKVDS